VMPVMTLCLVSVVWSWAQRRAYNDGKGDAKVVRQPPVALELLLVAKLGEAVLVSFFIAVGGAALDRGLFGEAHGRWRLIGGGYVVDLTVVFVRDGVWCLSLLF
jgi:hypothetical protein